MIGRVKWTRHDNATAQNWMHLIERSVFPSAAGREFSPKCCFPAVVANQHCSQFIRWGDVIVLSTKPRRNIGGILIMWTKRKLLAKIWTLLRHRYSQTMHFDQCIIPPTTVCKHRRFSTLYGCSIVHFQHGGTNCCGHTEVAVTHVLSGHEDSHMRVNQGFLKEFSELQNLLHLSVSAVERSVLHLELRIILMLTHNQHFNCTVWFHDCTNPYRTSHFV